MQETVSETKNSEANTIVDETFFSLIEQARQLLKDDRIERKTLKTSAPSKTTTANYLRKCALIDAAIDDVIDLGGPHLVQKLARYAPKTRSFFAMRAALKWRAVGRLAMLVNATKTLSLGSKTSLPCRQYTAAFHHAIHDYKIIQHTTRDVCLEWSGRSAQAVSSKKADLKQLPDDWRDRFVKAEEAYLTYRSQVVLMRFVGFRPWELEQGIQVKRRGDQVEVLIAGAKVRELAGQEWRKIRLSAKLLPDWLIQELPDGEARTYSAASGAMRAHLKRTSEKLFPRRAKEGFPSGPLVSAYLFRHALATDLKVEGWDAASIAGVLGESVAETSRWYGLRSTKRSGKRVNIAIDKNTIETARPVRPGHAFKPGSWSLQPGEKS